MKKRQVVVKLKRDFGNSTSSSAAGRNIVTRYGECQKNHAAYSGGYAVDGCTEYMASAGEGVLTCAACGCHRNFHKREVQSADRGTEYPPPNSVR